MDATTKQKLKAAYNAYRAGIEASKKNGAEAMALAAENLLLSFYRASYSATAAH